jgi:dTDP-4-amino-4,6-dideoxygalactose transaminase
MSIPFIRPAVGELETSSVALQPKAVPRISIPFFRPSIGEREASAVASVLRSGWLTSGPKVAEFEKRFSEMLGPDVEAVAVNSATAGLHLAAEACGIGPGDEVLVPTLTFTATAEIVRYLRAEVVLVDVEPNTLTIDLEQAALALTPRTKAIIVVHFGGLACRMREVCDFAKTHGLRVIEDAAHALPARSDGTLIGAGESDAAVFSFYANKTLTTGEGGMIVTRDPWIASRARTMRTHGLDRDAFDRFSKVGAGWAYDVVSPGFKYNMTDVAAAMGIVQLSRMSELQQKRQAVAELYHEQLEGLPLDKSARALPGDLHAWHLFTIRVHEDARSSRDDLIAALTSQGIGSSVHYTPLHLMTYWSRHCGGAGRSFPEADRYFAGAVSLPLFPDMGIAEVDAVCAVIRKVLT